MRRAARRLLTVGILAEAKNEWERRAPLVPQDVDWLQDRKIQVEVQSSTIRIFSDREYKHAGAKIVSSFKNADFLIGIKEPDPEALLSGKLYTFFSHTTKGQTHNRLLLKTLLRKKTTLIDYEHIVSRGGTRLVFFGRFAGICGMIDSLHYLGKRRESEGIQTPISFVRRSLDYGSYEKAKRHIRLVSREIKRIGFPQKLSPFIVGITGHGNVANGADEVMDLFDPIDIHPQEMSTFVRDQKSRRHKIYKIKFQREEKIRSKTGKGFYFEDYLEHPSLYESNLDLYLAELNLLINASYWDRRYPRLVPESMIQKLFSRHKRFRLGLIGDLTCDIGGTIEITKKATTPDRPTFVYNPRTRRISDGIEGEGIAVLAVDQLPCEFPEDSSIEFSRMIRDYVYQIASHGVIGITDEAVIPAEIRRAVVVEKGKLTPAFRYMKRYL